MIPTEHRDRAPAGERSGAQYGEWTIMEKARPPRMGNHSGFARAGEKKPKKTKGTYQA